MMPQPKARKVYQNHRDSQRERILEAAEMLFIRDGIDNVSLSSIADAARISRITLYQYFPNKQEVGWAIFQKVTQEIVADTADSSSQVEGSGFQRIEHMVLGSANLLITHPDHLRFIVEFNTLYAREGNPDRVRRIWAPEDDPLAAMIRLGIQDGSLRPNLNPYLLSAAVLNLLNALNSRFALLGDLIEEEYQQSVSDMYREICRAFLRGIQSTPPSQE